MPLTFPSHAAAVLPLKLWKPRWFDGIALTVGSAAPDVAYAMDGTWFEWPVKSLPPTWAIAHSLPGVVVWGLPVTLVCAFIIRWAFGFPWPAWWVTVSSALIGAASHVLWDRLAIAPVADIASSVIGALVAIGLLIHQGFRVPRISWPVLLVGCAFLPFLPGAELPHTTGVRILLIAAIAVILGRRQTAR